MSKPASQKIQPLKSVLISLSLNEVLGYRGLATPQRTVEVLTNRLEKNPLAMTRLPTPMTGMKLSMQEMQYNKSHPGRQGGTQLSASNFHKTQQVKMFLKMKQPSRKQNQTYVQPISRVKPTQYPMSRKCRMAWKGWALSVRQAEEQVTMENRMRSMMGKMQIIRNTASKPDSSSVNTFNNLGTSREKITYRLSRSSRGTALSTSDFLRSLAQMRAAATMRQLAIRKNIQWVQQSIRNTVMIESTIRQIRVVPMMLPIRFGREGHTHTSWAMKAMRGSFHRIQEKSRLMTILAGSFKTELVQMSLEEAQS